MSIQATITGRASEPRVTTTQSGKQVMSFGVAATPRRLDKATNQWGDDGEPLWVEVALWERDAERWQGLILKGTQVAVSAVLALESYETRSGERREKIVARNARVLGVVPAGNNTAVTSRNQAQGAPGGSQWGTTSPGAWEAPRNDSATFNDDSVPF